MQYQITSDNIELSPSMDALAREKFGKVEHRLTHVPEDLRSVRIVMNTAPTNTFQVKILLTVHGKEYFTDETDYTLEHAMIKSVNELERILKKDKIIATSSEWEQAREAKRLTEEELEAIAEEEVTE